MERKIIHIDMDAFYASVEQRDNPAYRGKPVIVGGSRNRGVVAAASYEARKYGIHSAMPTRTAINRYPKLIIVRPRFDVYKKISQQIRAIFKEYTDLVEPLSLDEAFLDVTRVKTGPPSATLIAEEIRRKIYLTTSLTSSAGVSINKFLAKVASDVNKPNGIFVIPPKKVEDFILKLPIEEFFGVGKVTAARMHEMGIFNGSDLRKCNKSELTRNFGKAGLHYYYIARGIDDRQVNPNRERKSVGTETTFESDLHSLEELKNEITYIARELHQRNEKANLPGRTLTLKVKYNNFVQVTRSHSEPNPINSLEEIISIAHQLINGLQALENPVRLLGLTISNAPGSNMKEDGQLVIEF